MKFMVGALIIKREGDSYLVMTQRRKVLDKSYDPLYDNTWETMGETVLGGESVITALIRGCREELGVSNFTPKNIRGALETWTTGKKDEFIYSEPLCFVQSLGPPQPWLGPFFIIEVLKDFEPNYKEGDGEATSCKWWEPAELKKEIEDSPQNFMGLHAPALYKLCLVIIERGLE